MNSLPKIAEPPLCPPHAARLCRRVHFALSAVVLLIGASNLAVWLLHLEHLPFVTVMRFNAALGLTFGGIALFLWREERLTARKAAVARVLGLLVLLIGGLTSAQYLFGIDFGIDQLFGPQLGDRVGLSTVRPGRMSLNAALTLFAGGLGLLLLDLPAAWRRQLRFSVAPLLAIVGALPVLAGLVGHGIGLAHFTGILGSTNILLHTAVAEFALCAAILTARPERWPMRLVVGSDAGGVLLRWLGPATVVFLLALGWLVHRGEMADFYGPREAIAIMIFLGLILLGALLLAAAAALALAEKRRQRADAAVREQEERFRTLADNISQLTWMTDETGAIVWYNQRWFEFTGTKREEMLGWGWEKVHHPEHLERVKQHFREAIAVGKQWEDTFPLRRADGEWRWFLSRALPRRDPSGQIIGWFGTNTDITEQRAAAQALAQAKESAERASKAKDEFLAALSHELRTPLTPVLMIAEEMCHDTSLSTELRAQLRMVRRNVRLESRLIDDLLDLTRIARGRLGLEAAPTDLHETLREAIEIVRDDAGARSLHLVEKLDRAPAWMLGDRTRLEQVFWNLLRNAVKFTPPGGRITVSTRQDDARQRWLLEVSDTGIGIAPEVLPVLFEKFEQGDRTNDHRFGGLGLGLAISKAIVELHGGVIEAASEGPGRGATFRVELGPLIAPPANASLPGEAPRAQVQLAPLRLLLVEDHSATSAVMARLLGRAGHHVTTADSVAAALAAAEREAFEIVICDLGLPDGTGHELMRQLRERYPLRGIAVSGYGMEEDVRRSRESGFEAHLTKPVEFAELHAALARLAQVAV